MSSTSEQAHLSTERPGHLLYGGARMVPLDIEGGFWGLLEILFDRMPMGIAILDRNLILRRCNPTWANFIERYTERSAADVIPGAHLYDIVPGIEKSAGALLRRALAGEMVRREARQLVSGDVSSYWDVVWSPLIENGEVVGIVDVSADATERVLARQDLERRVTERTRQLATLLEVTHNITSTLELEPLLGLILEQLKEVVDYAAATILTLDGTDLVVRAHRGPIPQQEALELRFPLAQAGANRVVIESREPAIIDDILGEAPLAGAFRETAGDQLHTTYGYVRSWAGVPLLVKQRVIGMLTLDHGEPGYYTPRRAHLALAFANQAAVAIENARLYQEEQERRREAEQRRRVAEGLRDVLAILNSDRPLSEVLDYILAQVGRLLGTERVALYRLHEEDATLRIQAARGLPREYVKGMSLAVGEGAVGRAVLERRPVAVCDVGAAPPEEGFPVAEPTPRRLPDANCRSLLAVPLTVKDEAYGSLVLYYPETREYSPEELALAAATADQAALAIENARLRDQVEQAAISAERSRLARDLHDAVTQTLFSASLIAEVLPRIWDRDAGQGRTRLEELRQLTRGALAEMRTLLLELRPPALVEAALGDLVRQLAEATTGRARVPVAVTVEGEGELPPDVQIGLYRIAQEALNNVAKHSGATEATLSLRQGSDEATGLACLELVVEDDGSGFDPEDVTLEHLGLGIMYERAQAIGAALAIETRPGEGTRVAVTWRGATSAAAEEVL